MPSSDYEYRKGDAFLEKAVDIFHNICKAEPILAFGYQGGRWGKARLRKLLLCLDCYDSIHKTGDSLELVRYFFLKNPSGFSEETSNNLYWKLFVQGRWKNPAPTKEEQEEAYQRRLKFLGPDYNPVESTT